MNSIEKAAAFLISIGSEAASEILKNMDDDTVVAITSEMSRIEQLSPEEKEEIIGDFMVDFNRIKNISYGGESFVRKTLVSSMGEERAESICNKIRTVSPEEGFSFLKNVSSDIIHNLIQNENSGTIALVFSNISSSQAGAVLQMLEPDKAKEVALRLARMRKVSPEAAMQVASALKKRYDALTSAEVLHDHPGGVDKLADILNHLDERTEQQIMSHFEKEQPDTARKIAERIYSFESVLDLTNYEVRILIDNLDSDELLSIALKGAGDEIRVKFLRNVSNNRATDIITEMERMGPVRMSDITKARREIVDIMRALDDAGTIVIKKNREKYVE